MKKDNIKTNAIRILDKNKINYIIHEYDNTCTDGKSVANLVGIDENKVFKTLVTVSNNNIHFVFCVPVNKSLNLKKAASIVGVKSIAMIHQKDLLGLTGYIHGGCSPIGMKKEFTTVIDESCLQFARICVSGGKVGVQIELATLDLIKYLNCRTADLTE